MTTPSLTLPRRGGGNGAPSRALHGRAVAGGSDDGVELLGRQVIVESTRVAHHRRELAAAEALDLLEAEEPVRAHLTELLDTDAGHDVVADLLGAAERAGEIRADVEVVLSSRPQVEERVEGGDALDVAGVEVQQLGHLAHGLRRQVTE